MRQKNFKIRSFVKREGRLTPSQARALSELLPVYGLPTTGKLNFKQIFNNNKSTELEIGFGNGEILIEAAFGKSEINFIGIEVHRPGVGRILNQIKQHKLDNLRVLNTDAVEVLENQIADEALQKISLLFPDPWHKKRHHKRRIVNESFLTESLRVLKPQGQLHIATDWKDYALSIVELGRKFPELENITENHNVIKMSDRSETKFEKRGKNLGHKIWEIVFEKT